MFLEKIKSDGLAHLSYFLGSGSEACVIDPRRDIDVYLDLAHRKGMQIVHIFETHRNEDLVSGAAALSKVTGAKVWHGPNPAEPIAYANTVNQGQTFDVGSVRIEAIETPGHTLDSVSYAMFDTRADEGAFGVFTGDTLFVGDVGRTDFYPDQKEKMAEHLYDSLQKLLALGDQAALYPAHGAGSVCGSGISDREVSSIGHERLHNPHLQFSTKDDFIAVKTQEFHYKPPYFQRMERLNVDGGERSSRDLLPTPLSVVSLFDDQSVQVVDVRGVADFAGAYVPGSICLPHDMLASFAGWFLDYEMDIILIARDADQASAATLSLARIGYDQIKGFVSGIMPVATQNRPFETLTFVDTERVKMRLQFSEDDWTLLDVRSKEEFDAGHIDGAAHAYVGQLPEAAEDIAKNRRLTLICGSGARATIAASVLLRAGYEVVDVYLGSMKAWNAAG